MDRNRFVALRGLVVWIAAVSLFGQTPSAAPPADAPYRNPDLAAEKRAADLVSRMTLEEKALQMQNSAPAIERLGVPAYDWWNEALHGVARAGQATVFPQAIGLAATWDTDLMFRIADIISTEARAKYHEAIRNNQHGRYQGLTFWSPNINIFRDPRWGRGQETYGEDPYLTGRLAVAFIRGMQGNDPHYFKTIATAKHYAVHSGPEPARHSFNVNPSPRDRKDTYLPAFRAAIVEGKAYSVMCAYNAVDGVPACVNTDLLVRTLKKEWGFEGYIVSDCGAIYDIYNGHKYKADAAEASVAAVRAGTDLTCGNEYRSLVGAVKAGQIAEAELDQSLVRLFTARFRLGMFDPDSLVPFARIPYSVNDSAGHRRVALEAARKSIVLLKNEGQFLPLAGPMRRIAVVGPAADDPEALLGNYNGFSSKIVSPLDGIAGRFASKGEVRFALGATYTEQSNALLAVSALTPPSGNGNGLLAEYFDNAEWQGTAKLRRIEPRPYIQPNVPDAEWKAAGVPGRGYSVRWTGTLKPPVSGEYVFVPRNGRFNAPVDMHVYLDDREIAAEEPAQGGQRGRRRLARLPARLEAGRGYRLRIEYRSPGPAAEASLGWIPPAKPLLAEAVEAAKDADVVLAFVGLNPSLEGEEMPVSVPGFLGGDRTDLNLPEAQQRLLEAVAGTGKPLVVVLTSGSAVAIRYAAERAAAVLAAWYGGEEIGTAIADTLDGTNNPAGRLPVTFYAGADQLPPFEDYSMKGRTYRYFRGKPLYEFGYGLSYSKFEYSGLRAERTDEGAEVSVQVKNASDRAGDEVVQLYVDGEGGAEDPIRSLRGFERIHLRSGESRQVRFTIPAGDVPKSRVQISVGGGLPTSGLPVARTTL